MLTATVTLGSLVDRALYDLEAPAERGRPVVMGSNALSSTTEFEFTLKSGSVDVSDLVEFGSELVLVTGKSGDMDPVYTCSRGYYNTEKAAHAEDAVGSANPQFARRRVADMVDRSFTRLEALGVPLIASSQEYREPGLQYLALGADVREVLQVLYLHPTTGRIVPLDGWQQYDHMPASFSSTGKALKLSRFVSDSDELTVVYTTPYQWSGGFPSEAATVELPEAAVELPALFAAAALVSGREVSRQELDRAEEWSRTEPVRGGAGNALVRLKWQEFYRSLDEARRVVGIEVPTHRPFIKRPKVRI
jgi:hypothetical protein